MAGGNRGAILITGASTGIGEACALRLAGLGFDVLAGVRGREAGERLSAAAPAGRVTPVELDVTDSAQVEAAGRIVDDRTGAAGVAGLVNNAGIAVAAPLEFLPIDELRAQLEVNVIGQVAVTQALLPALRRARGRIVNIGSVSGRIALPLGGAYSASKFALEALTDSLRRELRAMGIQVAIVEPGRIDTPMWTKGAKKADALIAGMPDEAQRLYGAIIAALRREAATAAGGIQPDAVADAVVHALTARRPKTRYLVAPDRVKRNVRLARFLPDRLFDALLVRAAKKGAAAQREEPQALAAGSPRGGGE